MKYKSAWLALILIASPAAADEASHREAAGDLLDMVSGPATLRAGFNLVLEPMLDSMRQQGAPEPLIVEFKEAFRDWLEKEIIWEEMKPEMVNLYVQEFAEAELREIIAFYKSPAGAKALKKLPTLVTAGGKIGEAYAKKKEEGLQRRLKVIIEKYQKKQAEEQPPEAPPEKKE
jgi:hypothetical protein